MTYPFKNLFMTRGKSEDESVPSPAKNTQNSKLPNPVTPDATRNTQHDHPENEHGLFGKIARLPHDIREQLNLRIHDGKSYSEILAWLNELPEVKEVLAAHFDGKPVNAPNLTHWRQTGYQRWCKEREHIASAEKMGEYASAFTKAAGGHFAPAAAITAGKIFEFVQSASTQELTPEVLAKCGAISSALAETEQNYTRLELARERIRQEDEKILITRDKFQRDCVGLMIRALNDDRAKQIEASSLNNEEKIEMLGYHIFDDLWVPRHIPTPEDFANTSVTGQSESNNHDQPNVT